MKTRVLIVDDSALMRQLLRQILEADPEIEVVGAASDPLKAWELIQRSPPDVLTLDVEMPRMNGLDFLKKLMRAHPLPVVMCSSLTESGKETTLRALGLGAVDFITKPKLDLQRGVADLADEIVQKVKTAARARPKAHHGTSSSQRIKAAAPVGLAAPIAASLAAGGSVIAIGASTGGTEALLEVLARLPADAPPVVVVQHMPEAFTKPFAQRLDRLCTIRVREAEDGAALARGQALIAPGGSRHTVVVRSEPYPIVRLVDAPPVNHHRPSVDVLFASCAAVLKDRCVGAILTGMGADGADGMVKMRQAGCRTIAQDEATCVVFGMPKEAIARGGAELVLPLGAVAGAMVRLSAEAQCA